jgi:hypothetical protein
MSDHERDRRRGGRPPLDPTDRSVSLTLRVPSKQYDRLCADAQRERCTVPELVRRSLDARKPNR